MKLAVEIDLGNDAMQTAADASDSINKALIRQSRSALDPLRAGEEGTIMDGNGNTVGTWKVEAEPLERIDFRSTEFLEAVENAWFRLMSGELQVGIDPESDMEMTELVVTLAEKGRENVEMVASAQYDGEGNEIPDGEMSADEYARRVASALAVLFYGGS